VSSTYVTDRESASVTSFTLLDLLVTRRRQLIAYGADVPPQLQPLVPTYRDHVPYLVL